jgi:hypothetical protein
MIQAGKSITRPGDPLQKIDINYLYQAIINPRKQQREFIEQLRTLRTIDETQYRKQKRFLPYITTGIFKPAIRRTENFAKIDYFLIDLDHISEHERDIQQVKIELQQDKRVVLLFASPGNDGLKVMFRLKESCYDHGKYSIFYKHFARQFAITKRLEGIVDMNTSDVTRACFISYDTTAYFNAEAEPIDMQDYLNFDNPYEIKLETKAHNEYLKENKEILSNPTEKPDNQNLDEDILKQIKKTLNPNYREKPEKNIYVPEEINEIIAELEASLNQHQLELSEVSGINFGKKLRISLGRRWAEINVFYGKKGFSLVKTPKRGSDKELTDIAYQILAEQLFYQQ